MEKPAITVFTLGGTIAMAPGASAAGVTPALKADDLLAAVPGLGDVCTITAVDVRNLPGAHLALSDILDLARAIADAREAGAAGAVVTQGTDTMEDTAFVLDQVLDPAFPVVVTGAMRHPGLAGADGPANLLAACVTSTSEAARGLGTLVVMNDQVHAAALVRKTNTVRPDAFASPSAGPIGFVAEGRAQILMRPRARSPVPLAALAEPLPRVDQIAFGLGEDGALARAAVDGGAAGLVAEAMGAGHVGPVAAEALGEIAARVPVALASRTGSGPVLRATYGFTGSETDLLARGLISAGWLTAAKARLLLTLALAAGYDSAAVRSGFAAFGGG